MKIKKSIINLSSIGLLTTVAPISFVTTNQVTFANSQSMQSLCLGDNLIEIKSINKSRKKLVTFDLSISETSPYCDISNIESRVKIEGGVETPGKAAKNERDDLFSYSRKDTQYTSYHRYESNDIEKSNNISWGNAKKYQLNVTVPTNTKEYKVQVVADVKIKNCIEGGTSSNTYSFAQATLSQLSTSVEDILMPYMGIKNENIYQYNRECFKIASHNDLFTLFEGSYWNESKPYGEARLSSIITLSNETPEDKEIPVYFWYGFFGGGFTGEGHGSHINCSEVTFSTNHVE